MKLSKKMLKEMVSDAVNEAFGFTSGPARETEDEFQKRMKDLGLATGPEGGTKYQTPADPLEVIAELNREITRLQSMNLALINQLSEYGVEPKIAHAGDPDTKASLDTIRRKK